MRGKIDIEIYVHCTVMKSGYDRALKREEDLPELSEANPPYGKNQR